MSSSASSSASSSLVMLDTLLGSRLYGTHRPDSDVDALQVVLPSAKDIVLGRGFFSLHDPKHAEGDIQTHTLGRYIDMLHAGSGPAVESFFAPPTAHRQAVHPVFISLRPKLLSVVPRTIPGILDFCKSQLNRSQKGPNNLAAITAVLGAVDATSGHTLASAFLALAEVAAAMPDRVSMVEVLSGHGLMPHVQVLDRKFPQTLPRKDFLTSMHSLQRRYGKTATGATVMPDGSSIDLRSLSHALRLAHEAMEFLTTGVITFPRPNPAYILAARLGHIPPDVVRQEVQETYEKAMDIVVRMIGPDLVDAQAIDAVEAVKTDVYLAHVQGRLV